MVKYFEANPNIVDVYLDNKFVGIIQKVIAGYQYVTKDGKHFGLVYPTLFACKKSLEENV